jgi:general secretion pathway protein D
MGNNSATPSAPLKAGATVTLDFANAEIDAVARTLATVTGRNVVVDPRVKGTMTLASTNPVTPAEALRLFSAQLRAQGYALVDSEGIYVVVPEADAKLQAAGVSAGPVKGGGQIQTQIFRLTHENASNLVPVLRPLISPNNTINVDAGTNALVITDYGDNLQRIGRIIAALDVANATGVEVVRLHYAVASDLAPLVAKLLEPGGGPPAANAAPNVQQIPRPGGNASAASVVGGGGDGYRTTLIPEPRSNAIIVRAANPARLAMAKSLIEQLDQPADTRAGAGEGGNIHVVYLKNADAAKLAVTLRAALAALPGQSNSQNAGAAAGGNNTANTAPPPASNTNTAMSSNGSTSSTGMDSGPSINATANNQPNTGGQIQADPATNSLIISAPEPVYRELRAVIDQLDQRRAQVYVESLIAEINTDREADFGIQWQGFMKNGSTVGVLGTNFSTPSATVPGTTSTNIIDFAGQFLGMNQAGWTPSVMPSPGFNLMVGSSVLGALANFIQSSGAGNVLSTPTLLTLDNEEARIMVGQNVPVVTGSYANTGVGTSSALITPFQTYDREDVGITLRVKPQISEDGTIKLVIYQEVSDVVAGTIASASGPSINKRAIESSVLVNDGAIVVLGGLLEDQYSSTEDKVPVLGDVPLLGNLFKSRNRSYTKTNLMVFLRPVIVRDAAAAERYSLDRYDMMRALQQGAQPTPSSVLNVGGAQVMPAATPVNPQTTSRPAPPAPLMRVVPGDAGPPVPGSPTQPQPFAPTSGDRSDDSGAPIQTKP